jgi:ribosomal 50S subunit-recycling heat shock protein
MRIDLTLKYLCLVKSRSVAKALCEKDLVLVDGRPVRPAARAPAGSRVTILLRKRTISIELLEIPRKQLSKSAAVDYYRPVTSTASSTTSISTAPPNPTRPPGYPDALERDRQEGDS